MISHAKRSPAAAKTRPKRTKKPAVAASEPESATPVILAPVVVDGGSRSKSSLRHLEQGTGPLVDEISRIVQAIHGSIPEPVPIVIKYRERPNSNSRSASPFGLFF